MGICFRLNTVRRVKYAINNVNLIVQIKEEKIQDFYYMPFYFILENSLNLFTIWVISTESNMFPLTKYWLTIY